MGQLRVRAPRAVLVTQWSGLAIDRADDLLAHNERADVAARLVDMALQIEDRVLGPAEQRLVLEQRLGGVAVVDSRQQPSP